MKDTLVLNITFSFFIILNIYFFINKIIKNSFDKILGTIAIVCSIIILYSINQSYKKYLDLGHYLYCGFYLPLIAIFSTNKTMLGLNIIMITLVIYSRYYYKCCVLSKKQNNKGFFTELSHIFKLNWDYLFLILLIFSIYNYLCL